MVWSRLEWGRQVSNKKLTTLAVRTRLVQVVWYSGQVIVDCILLVGKGSRRRVIYRESRENTLRKYHERDCIFATGRSRLLLALQLTWTCAAPPPTNFDMVDPSLVSPTPEIRSNRLLPHSRIRICPFWFNRLSQSNGKKAYNCTT